MVPVCVAKLECRDATGLLEIGESAGSLCRSRMGSRGTEEWEVELGKFDTGSAMGQPSRFARDNRPLLESNSARQVTQDATNAARVEAGTGGNLR